MLDFDSFEGSLLTNLLGNEKSDRFSGRLSSVINGEPSRARTCDPLIKSQLLYQLSYRPIKRRGNYTWLL